MSRFAVDQPNMTVSPGWYADPTVYGGLRWWDGAQWTGHATPPASVQPYAPQQFAPQQYVPGQPARRFSAGKVIGAVAGVFVVAPLIADIAIPVFLRHSSSPTCGTEAPVGASSEARAYVTVVHEEYRQLAAYSRYVGEHGGAHQLTTPAEYALYRKLENDFADGVAAIPFSGKAAIDAPDVVNGSRAIVADLDELMSAPTQAAHNRLHADLASSNSVLLRTDLGLTPRGTGCTFCQPG